MINHIRTLLMNVDGSFRPGEDGIGEEYVDPDFRVRRLPSYLQTLRKEFFGSDPDRLMLNYRLRQIMGAIHSTDLDEYARADDPRITYLPFRQRQLFDVSTFTPSANLISGTAVDFSGTAAMIDDFGRVETRFAVTLLGGLQVRVEQQTPPTSVVTSDYTVSAGFSSPITLGGSGYYMRFQNPVTGNEARVTTRSRPQRDLGEIAANVDELSEEVKLQLFQFDRIDPFLTLRNLWERTNEVPWRIGALTIAMALRTAEQPANGT